MKQAWSDLTLLLAGGIERRPRATIAWAILLPIALATWWPAPAFATAVAGGLILGRREPSANAHAVALCVGYLALLAVAVGLRAESGTAAVFWTSIMSVAFVGPLLLNAGTMGARASTLVTHALVAVAVMAFALAAETSERWSGAALSLHLALLIGSAQVVCRRPGRASVVLCLLALASGVSAMTMSSEFRFDLALVVVQLISVSGLALFAGAAGHLGDDAPSASVRADALGRWARRLQHHPWRVAILTSLVVVGLSWRLTMVTVYLYNQAAPAVGVVGDAPQEFNALILAAVLCAAPLTGALLGRAVAGRLRSLGRLSSLAVVTLVFAACYAGHVFLMSGRSPEPGFDHPHAWFYILGLGAVPAGLAAVLPVPRALIRRPVLAALAWGFFSACLPWTWAFSPSAVLALVGLGVLSRWAMACPSRLWLALAATVMGVGLSDSVFSSLEEARNLEEYTEPALVMALGSVIFAWPFIVVGRLFGSATAVPKEHPIYADFGGPVERGPGGGAQ